MNQVEFEKYRKLAVHIGVQQAHGYGHSNNVEGCKSVAVMILLEVLKDLPNQDKPEGYLVNKVREGVQKFIANDRIISCSRSTFKDNHKAKQTFDISNSYNLMHPITAESEKSRLAELLSSSKLTDREKIIAEMIIAGASLVEIETRLGLASRTVRQAKRQLGEKLINIMNSDKVNYNNLLN